MRSIKHEIVTKQIVEIPIELCVGCNSDDIELIEYTDNGGPPIYGGECRKCWRKCTANHGSTQKDAVDIWNAQNNIQVLIMAELSKIKGCNARIDVLNGIAESRKKNQKNK